MFEAPVFTTAGKELLTRNIAGEEIVFTTIQMGSGYISESIDGMTSLIKNEATINVSVKNEDNQYVTVSASFTNQGLTGGFYWREVGVFAADPENPNDRSKDILYCYQNAYDTAELIPPPSTATIEKGISIPIIVGNAASVSAAINKSLIYITAKDLEAHNDDSNSHPNLFQKIKEYISDALKNLSSVVKTINGNSPDEDGNIAIDFMPKPGGTFSGRVNFWNTAYYIDSSSANSGAASLRSVSTTGNISSGQNVTAANNMIANGSISAGENVTATGYVTASKTYHAVYNDYAELMPKGEITSPGDILALDLSSSEEKYIKASRDNQMVVGVHSDEYASLIGGEEPPKGVDLYQHNREKYVPVSLVGRVHAKVIGKVRTGDIIIISEYPGVGRAAKVGEYFNPISVVGFAVEGDDRTDERRLRIRVKG
ncbi:MAG: hypothetical protein ACI4JC_01025 [Faecalibacterium sp.]